ncbi:hypothetical protein CKQ90_35535, partial [Klebsiella pneumoniae]
MAAACRYFTQGLSDDDPGRKDMLNPGLANLLLEQFGGPQGELAAACRYFTQGLSDDDPGRKDML